MAGAPERWEESAHDPVIIASRIPMIAKAPLDRSARLAGMVVLAIAPAALGTFCVGGIGDPDL
jgi:hypothetical protein